MKKDPRSNDGQIGNLFKRYQQKFKPPQKTVIVEAVVVIEEVTGIVVPHNQLSYTPHTRTLYIKTPSIIKSEIFRQKEGIKKALQKRLGESYSPVDVV
jgi:hypothetical protein